MVTDNTKFAPNKSTRFKCIHDDRVWCGNFASWEDFCHWDGEKACKVMCNKGHRHAAAVQSGEFNKKFPKANQIRRYFNKNTKRPYQVRERGRQVA